MALERSCEYVCWCVVLPNQTALTCEVTGPPRPVLWATLYDALDHYGTDVTIDDNPPRHLVPALPTFLAPSAAAPSASAALVADTGRRVDGAAPRRGRRSHLQPGPRRPPQPPQPPRPHRAGR
jgi:hypothetical protein